MIDKAKIRDQLKKLYPDDVKMRDAVLFAIGVTEQLPVMNQALMEQLVNLPKDVFEVENWEEQTHHSVADVIRWSTSLEMSLHDLRAAIFYRINNRAKLPLTEEQEARKAARQEAKQSLAAAPAVPEEAQPSPAPDDRATRSAKNISSLFKNLKK